MKLPALDIPDDGALGRNITHFARALRRAGLPIGPGRVIDAVRAVQVAGFSQKEDFFHTLKACFVNRPEHAAIFAQTFRLYWRDPQFLDHMMSLLMPVVGGLQEDRVAQPAEKRAAQALLDGVGPDISQNSDDRGETEIEVDASQTTSAADRLRTLDFEQMSTEEMAQALRLLSAMTLPTKPLVARRRKFGAGPIVDGKETLRQAARQGGEVRTVVTKRLSTRPPSLVVLCDISGSMAAYSRAVLHFIHSISNDRSSGWGDVHAFTFGTRLTNITRHMRTRDVDASLAAAGQDAQDWDGGTRIGACLMQFNRDWSRRVLGQGASVVLITDGLDCGPSADLEKAMARLQRTARQVVWVNPLMRWQEFAPKAEGIRAMMPYVSSFRAGHNIASLEGMAAALSDTGDSGEKARMIAMMRTVASNPKDATLG